MGNESHSEKSVTCSRLHSAEVMQWGLTRRSSTDKYQTFPSYFSHNTCILLIGSEKLKKESETKQLISHKWYPAKMEGYKSVSLSLPGIMLDQNH